jgi:hypothetical protein
MQLHLWRCGVLRGTLAICSLLPKRNRGTALRLEEKMGAICAAYHPGHPYAVGSRYEG